MKRTIAFPILATLAACSFEPLRAPDIPVTTQYTPTPIVARTAAADVPGGASQQFVVGKDIPEQWWELFQSPALVGLVRDALTNSPTLAKVAARLRQSEEDLSARSGATEWPRVDAKLSAYRADVSGQPLGVEALSSAFPLNLYLASVNVSYTFDFFGATRGELDALRAEIDYQRYQLEAARLTLAANVVTAAIREAALRQKIATTEQMIELQSRQLAIVERLEEIGGAARADVVMQRGELARTRVSLTEQQQALDQVRHRLAIYTGRPPSAPGLPQFRLSELALPSDLPLSLPSELLRQRPDIRAAEALLAQAGAKVGVATANFYPQFTISAIGGSFAANGVALFSGNAWLYLLGASLSQPIFHGGELQAKRRSAVAAYEQASAAYREAVLLGFQNVADTLRALESDAVKLQERAAATAQARKYYEITSGRYAAGGVSHFALLDAERKLRNEEIAQTQAVADRYADSAALLQALGGGWWKEGGEPGKASSAAAENH